MAHKFGIFLLTILISVQLGLIGVIFFQYGTAKPGTYFGFLPDNTVQPIDALARPNASPKALLSWATIAATAAYTLDFVYYQDSLNSLRSYFTEAGYQSFIAALNDSKVISDIIEKKLVVSSVAIGPSIIAREGETRGYHNWQIQVPILVTYQSASALLKREKIITLYVKQVPTKEASTGIGIDQFVTQNLEIEI